MHGDVVRSIALDFVLRIVWAGMMRIAFVIHVVGMNPDNPAADMSGFGIPCNMVSDFKLLFQFHSPPRMRAMFSR